MLLQLLMHHNHRIPIGDLLLDKHIEDIYLYILVWTIPYVKYRCYISYLKCKTVNKFLIKNIVALTPKSSPQLGDSVTVTPIEIVSLSCFFKYISILWFPRMLVVKLPRELTKVGQHLITSLNFFNFGITKLPRLI